jgi:hypothetical protein
MDEISGRLLLVDIWNDLYVEELKEALDSVQSGREGQATSFRLLTCQTP